MFFNLFSFVKGRSAIFMIVGGVLLSQLALANPSAPIVMANRLASPSNLASSNSALATSSGETLRDSCSAHFQNVRQSEVAVRNLESRSVPMVRFGGKPDVALYQKLHRAHQGKIAMERSRLKKQESLLSSCLADALRSGTKSIANAPVSSERIPARLPASLEVQVYQHRHAGPSLQPTTTRPPEPASSGDFRTAR